MLSIAVCLNILISNDFDVLYKISDCPEHNLNHAEDADASEQSKSASCEDEKDLDI